MQPERMDAFVTKRLFIARLSLFALIAGRAAKAAGEARPEFAPEGFFLRSTPRR
jgi:hypothetical protein